MAELRCADGTVVQISAETEQELREAFGSKPKPVHGDIVTCIYGRRVMLYAPTELGLWAYDSHGDRVGCLQPNPDFYVPTGENIFKGGVL